MPGTESSSLVASRGYVIVYTELGMPASRVHAPQHMGLNLTAMATRIQQSVALLTGLPALRCLSISFAISAGGALERACVRHLGWWQVRLVRC